MDRNRHGPPRSAPGEDTHPEAVSSGGDLERDGFKTVLGEGLPHDVREVEQEEIAVRRARLEVKAKEVSPRTIRIYRNEVDHILPYLGRLQLDKLTPMQVQKMQLEIADKTSARMAKATRGLLRNALNDAVRMGLVVRNVADLVKPVRYLRPKFQIWNAEEVVRFLQFARTHWYHPLFYTALSTGLRVGELIALEWPDIHEDALHVQRTFKTGAHGPEAGPPKTRQSNRVIKLPRDLLQMLAEHQSNLHRLELGDGLVFPSRAGHFLNPSNVRRSLHAISRKADVKIVRPHDLRHTHAAMCIANGMDVMRLAVRLGHADPGFTLRRYGHIFERYRPDEAPSMDELTGVSEASKVNSKVTADFIMND